jgi:hypothetical protein
MPAESRKTMVNADKAVMTFTAVRPYLTSDANILTLAKQ